MFTSPGGENEYKKPSITREHYDAVVEAKKERDENLIESESGKSQSQSCMAWTIVNRHKNLNFPCVCSGGGTSGLEGFVV